MFVVTRKGIEETSTKVVKSLPGLRLSLTSTNKIQIRDLHFIGARTAELRLAVFNPSYFGDYAKITRLKHRAKDMKVVEKMPFLYYVNN